MQSNSSASSGTLTSIKDLSKDQMNAIREDVHKIKSGPGAILGWVGRLSSLLRDRKISTREADQIEELVMDDMVIQQLVLEVMYKERDIFDLLTYPTLTESSPDTSPLEAQFTPEGDEVAVAIRAWNTPFLGEAAKRLYIAINLMNNQRKMKDYANFVAIVQSSGTGKSRTADQLALSMFVLAFNFRPSSDLTGYPRGDLGISDLLDPLNITATQLYVRYTKFFRILFQNVTEELKALPDETSQERLATSFRSWLKDHRGQLYAKVIKATRGSILDSDPQYISPKPAVGTGSTKKEYGLFLERERKQAIQCGSELIELIKKKSGVTTPSGYLESLAEDGRPNRPVWLAMYFDESHPLTQHTPINDDGKGYTSYQILCSVINNLRELDLFGIFLSTNSKLVVPAPPQAFYWSGRGRNEKTHGVQTPLTEMVFDEYPVRLLTENLHSLEEVCKPKFMVRFGRPLFWTRYEAGDPKIRERIATFAWTKLDGTSYDKEKALPDQGKLAALSVRIGISFARDRYDARVLESRLVEGHMRLAISTPAHREYSYTTTPSEPILAEAAAQLMKFNDLHLNLPKVLFDMCNNGLIAKGERGELISRLLLTKAHDFVIHHLPLTGTFTQPIRLVHFLEGLVGSKGKKEILNALPDNIPDGVSLQDSPLGNAWLNFTHWSKAGDNSAVTDEAAWIALGRCFAWQCYDQQEDVDLITPLAFDTREKLGRHNVSAIFWQIKNRSKRQKVKIDAEKLGFFSPVPKLVNADKKKADSRPYLTIVLDLGAEPANPKKTRSNLELESQAGQPLEHKESTWNAIIPSPAKQQGPTWSNLSHPTHPRYALSIIGCSHDSFPELIHRGEEGRYESILSTREFAEEHVRQEREFQEAIVQMKPTWKLGFEGLNSYHDIGLEEPSRLTRSLPRASEKHGLRVHTFGESANEEGRGAQDGSNRNVENNDQVGGPMHEDGQQETQGEPSGMMQTQDIGEADSEDIEMNLGCDEGIFGGGVRGCTTKPSNRA